MKLFILNLVALVGILSNGKTTNTSDQIIGKWENPDKTRQIEIFKKENQYFGKIIGLKDPKNVKVKEGDIVMKDILFQKDRWLGKIKVPAKENDFEMEITMPNKDKLEIKAIYGIMSRTKTWTRIK